MQNVQGYSAIETVFARCPAPTMIVVVAATLPRRFSARFGRGFFVVAGLLLCALANLRALPSNPLAVLGHLAWLVVFASGPRSRCRVLAATVVADSTSEGRCVRGCSIRRPSSGPRSAWPFSGRSEATVGPERWTSFAAVCRR